jgi:hypothetical protein
VPPQTFCAHSECVYTSRVSDPAEACPKDRPTGEQIQKMPAEEYKDRVLGNPQTEQWVNDVVTGNAALKKHMQKLAREAIIFMLVGLALVFVGLSVFLYVDSSKSAPIFDAIGPALLNTWIGLPVGLGIWVFYRAIRFAVEG